MTYLAELLIPKIPDGLIDVTLLAFILTRWQLTDLLPNTKPSCTYTDLESRPPTSRGG